VGVVLCEWLHTYYITGAVMCVCGTSYVTSVGVMLRVTLVT